MKTPENFFRHWWWIVMCAVIFAAIGSLLATVLPQQHRAAVDVQILFETNREINWTDKYMLSFTEEIGDIMEEAAIQTAVIQQLSSQGFSINRDHFRRYTAKEQRFYGWKMIVTTHDAELTVALLEEWRTVVTAAIQQDMEAGQQAHQHQILASAWIPCLQQLPAEPIHPFCHPNNAASIASLYTQAFNQYRASQASIHYLASYPPHYSVQFFKQTPVISTPSLSQPIAIVAGVLLGILIGTITIQHPWTRHLQLKRGES